MADPDLKLRVGGFDLLAMLAFLPSAIPSFFAKKRGRLPRVPPLDRHWLVGWLLASFVRSFIQVRYRTILPVLVWIWVCMGFDYLLKIGFILRAPWLKLHILSKIKL